LRDTETGEQHSHMVSDFGNYGTVCGLSDDDDQFEVVPELTGASPNGGIDCEHCYATFRLCKTYRARDFAHAAAPAQEPSNQGSAG
jgi:hypothetical protein